MTHRHWRCVWGLRQVVRAFRIGVFVIASTQLSLAGGSDPGDMPSAPQEPVTVTNPTTGQPITLTPEIPQYGNLGNGTPSNPLTGGLVSSPPVTVTPPPPADPPPQPPAPPAPPAQPPDPAGPGLQPPLLPITDPGGPPLQGGVSTQPPPGGSGLLKGGVSIGVPGTDDPPAIPGHGTPGAAPELQFWEGVTAGARDVYTNEWAKMPLTTLQKLAAEFGPGWAKFLLNVKDITEKVDDIQKMIEKSGQNIDGLNSYQTGYLLGQRIAQIVVLTNAGELVSAGAPGAVAE
jgi:hypothetical protein